MVVIPGPVEFIMGTPPAELNRKEDETQHKRRIGRTFAIAAKSVTLEQYRRFNPAFEVATTYSQICRNCRWWRHRGLRRWNTATG